MTDDRRPTTDERRPMMEIDGLVPGEMMPRAWRSDALGAGRISAVKGSGGFHLMADAGNDGGHPTACARASRPKPAVCHHGPRSGPGAGALLRPTRRRGASDSAECADRCCWRRLQFQVTGDRDRGSGIRDQGRESEWSWKQRTLRRRRRQRPKSPPTTHISGVMLPYTAAPPSAAARDGFPVVATSGNLRRQPICNREPRPLLRARLNRDRLPGA